MKFVDIVTVQLEVTSQGVKDTYFLIHVIIQFSTYLCFLFHVPIPFTVSSLDLGCDFQEARGLFLVYDFTLL